MAPPSLEQCRDALEVFLIDGNIEIFLELVYATRQNTLSPAMLAAALDKDRTAPDLCFAEVAKQDHVEWRAELRRRDADLDSVIQYLARMAIREPWPPW